MSAHRATVEWALAPGEDFSAGRYSRGHQISFAGQTLAGTASSHVVGAWAAPGAADPEEMLVAAISSCHMLSFLHVARLAGFAVSRYRDGAEGVLEPNTDGRLAVTRVVLRPAIIYDGVAPTPGEAEMLHDRAHETCFIAASVTARVTVETANAH